MRRTLGAAILVCVLGGARVCAWLSTRGKVAVVAVTDSPVNAADDSTRVLPPTSSSSPDLPARFALQPLAFLSSAPAESLDLLPGVGPVLATRLIDARRAHGPFRSWDDVDRVRGIGPKTIERLKAMGITRPPAPSPTGTSARASGGNLRNPKDERTVAGKP